ncbi:hypothetical protein BLA23254_05222 [Burkholderia lata]|uniref:Uncharacterized protein n=1 Tax=Burkholderia lata (strain ATCC 17760 / DSM 23089 / LMG 22485 / NCIMB 9086 / R18194 / 383) TaxID=482957 RepID=A0A6P2PRU9_BURL3|nr:hypothetical protein BLA23254_05222 [Burkholderia lata]
MLGGRYELALQRLLRSHARHFGAGASALTPVPSSGICSMRNEVRDRVYSRYLFRRDKCGRCELNCRVSGTIDIRTPGRVMRKSLEPACSGPHTGVTTARDDACGRLRRFAQRFAADSGGIGCAGRGRGAEAGRRAGLSARACGSDAQFRRVVESPGSRLRNPLVDDRRVEHRCAFGFLERPLAARRVEAALAAQQRAAVEYLGDPVDEHAHLR